MHRVNSRTGLCRRRRAGAGCRATPGSARAGRKRTRGPCDSPCTPRRSGSSSRRRPSPRAAAVLGRPFLEGERGPLGVHLGGGRLSQDPECSLSFEADHFRMYSWGASVSGGSRGRILVLRSGLFRVAPVERVAFSRALIEHGYYWERKRDDSRRPWAARSEAQRAAGLASIMCSRQYPPIRSRRIIGQITS